MNIETTKISQTENKNKQANTQASNTTESSVKFSDELKELQKEGNSNNQTEVASEIKEHPADDIKKDSIINNTVKEQTNKFNSALKEINSIVKELNQSDDKILESIKKPSFSADKIEKGDILINNDFNIQENKDLLPQMNPNMNFGGDGQPFSSFMNNDSQTNQQNKKLSINAKDLAEENAILSTMAENIAIANRNQIQAEQILQEKTVTKEEGIKKVDIKTGITTEIIVKYDSIIMNQADVEVFANLVEKGVADLDNLAPEAAKKAIQTSKSLSDLLAKAMDSKQPVRIDFDNNISVIIRISRDGKISAEFLPSSQVAEAYLKENLPLLKQRFDDNNIKYDDLSQRERREQNREQNRKKGRNNE